MSCENREKFIAKHVAQSMCLHLLFKYRPLTAPAQCVESAFDVSLSEEASKSQLWIAYQRLGVCVRGGCCVTEHSLFPMVKENNLVDNIMNMDPSSDHALSYIVLGTGVSDVVYFFLITFLGVSDMVLTH